MLMSIVFSFFSIFVVCVTPHNDISHPQCMFGNRFCNVHFVVRVRLVLG